MQRKWLVGFGVVSLVGCAVASSDRQGGDAPGPQPSDVTVPPGAAEAPVPQAVQDRVAQIRAGIASNGRTFNATSNSVVGGEMTPDVNVQMRAAALRMAKTIAQSAQKVDYNITTGAPVRTTATTYGDSWVSNSRTDMVAFATDASTFGNNASVGISGGVVNSLTNAITKSDLFVITDLYPGLSGAGASPSVLYTNNAHSESYVHGGLFFNFDSTNTELFSLSTTSHVYCNVATKWSGTGSPPASSSFANCGGWGGSGTTGGTGNSTTVTWSGPYPIFNSAGDVIRIYWGTDSGTLACVSIASPTSGGPTQCTGFPVTLNSGVKLGPPTAFQGSASDYTIFVGDENGILWEVYDKGTATPSKGSYRLCGGTGTASCGTAYQVHSAPALDFGNNTAIVAAGGSLFAFSTSFSTSPTLAASIALSPSTTWTDPINANPVPDYSNGYLYVTANNTLFKAPRGLGSVTSTALNKQTTSSIEIDTLIINPQSQPMGFPLAYNGQVYVNTASGGTSSSTATGQVEEYGCVTSSSAPGFTAVTRPGGSASTYGVMTSTGDVLDYASGNLTFGYDNGQTAAGSDGTGGLVGYNLPTANWSCPSPYSTGTLSCGGSGCTLAAGSCAHDSDCSGTTPYCNTTTNKCVGCSTDAQCTSAHGSGWICSTSGTNPSNTCVQSTHCTSSATCTTSPRTVCDLTTTSPYYQTCQQCATGSTGNCTGSTAVCVLITTDANYDTCQQCDSAVQTACTSAGKVCDTTAGDTNFDKCVACSPPGSTSGNGCTTTHPVCSTSSTCVECTTDSQCPGFAAGNTLLSCTSSNVCTCVSSSDCPGGSTCTANRCQ